MKKGLVVLFPGARYSVDRSLLYFAGQKYAQEQGYDVVGVSDYGVRAPEVTYEEYSEQAKKGVEEQLKQLDFSAYKEVVFVSKSMGTVLALWAEDEFQLSHVVHVLLTPIRITLKYLNPKRKVRLIASGTKDKLMDPEQLREVCRQYKLPLVQIKGVGHQLEVKGNVQKSLAILESLVKRM